MYIFYYDYYDYNDNQRCILLVEAMVGAGILCYFPNISQKCFPFFSLKHIFSQIFPTFSLTHMLVKGD